MLAGYQATKPMATLNLIARVDAERLSYLYAGEMKSAFQPAPFLRAAGESRSHSTRYGPPARNIKNGLPRLDTYAAMERWMDANGYRPGGAPWESYVTDPGECPDVNDWRTEVYWPLEK